MGPLFARAVHLPRPALPFGRQVIAQEFVVFQLGVVERVFAEDDASVGQRGSPAADRLHHSPSHIVRLAVTLEPFQRRPVAAVGRIAQDQHVGCSAQLRRRTWARKVKVTRSVSIELEMNATGAYRGRVFPC